jgi:hypothetical protein
VLEELGIALPATRPPVPEAEPQPADAK